MDCYAEPCISHHRDVCPSVHLVLPLCQNDASRITKASPSDTSQTQLLGIQGSSRNLKGPHRARAFNESGVGKIGGF